MSAVARRYGRALFEASEASHRDTLGDELRRFWSAVTSSPELSEVLHNPALKKDRSRVLDALFTKLSIAGATAKLVRLLSEHDRIGIIEEIAMEVETFADAHAGRLRAVVTSAVLPTAEQQARIGAALQKRLGKPVIVTIKVDPTLMGGLVCQVGDVTLDSSLKRQLAILTERLGAQAH